MITRITSFGFSSFLCICLLFLQESYGQSLTPRQMGAIREAVEPPQSSLNFNLGVSLDNIQVNTPKDSEEEEALPEDIKGLTEYIGSHEIRDSWPFVKLQKLYQQELDPVAGGDAIMLGIRRMDEIVAEEGWSLDIAKEQSNLYLAIGRPDYAALPLKMYLLEDPNSAEAWGHLGLMEASVGNVDSALVHLIKGYQIAPKTPDLYVGAFSEALFRAFIMLQSVPTDEEGNPNVALNELVSTSFLDVTIREYPDLELGQVAKSAVLTMAALIETSIRNSEAMSMREPVKFSYPEWVPAHISETEKLFSGKVAKYKRPELPLKILLMCAVLKQDDAKAAKWMKMLGGLESTDEDALRLMVLLKLMQTKFKEALPYAQRAATVAPTVENLELQARVEYMAGNFTAGREAGRSAARLGGSPSYANATAVAYAIKSDQMDIAIEISNAPETIKTDEYGKKLPEWQFLDAVLELLEGDGKKAVESMRQIGEETDYYVKAQEILEIVGG